jgi:hypothetical protein
MLDQVIAWIQANGQFIAAVIAILTPLLPTMVVKVFNDKKLIAKLQEIRSTEDLKRLSSDLLNEKVVKLQSQLDALLKNQQIGETIQKALSTTQEKMLEIETLSKQAIAQNMDVINSAVLDLQKLIPDLKNEFYMIVQNNKKE